MASYKSLLVWKKAHELFLDVSQVTRAFPPDERFALTDQLRRAALSVPANIVEGQAFGSTPVFLRHLAIACGSLAETRYLLQVAYELQYLPPEQYATAEGLAEETSRLLTRLRQSLQRS
ncbi:MAG: four helix bundle protein [Armatimonadia bacterium]